jgi:hypothetical protein
MRVMEIRERDDCSEFKEDRGWMRAELGPLVSRRVGEGGEIFAGAKRACSHSGPQRAFAITSFLSQLLPLIDN